jgi:signal transduction histidine kinase
MHLRRIKVLAVVVPTVGLFGFELFRHFVLQPAMGEPAPHLAEHIVSAFVLTFGVVGFAFVVFRLLERLHDQLLAVNEAAITVTADLSVDRVLERVAELARKVAGASYASVQVERQPARTVSSGRAPEQGPLLVLPIVVKSERLGELVLAGPRGRRFRESDLRALETFATQAGIALENAHLFEQIQGLVANRERARIGMDLHDGVIQELYAVGLKVEDAAELAMSDPLEAADVMREVQGVLRGVIGEVRTYVYGLQDGDHSVDLGPAIERVVAEFPSGEPAVSLAVTGGPRLPAAVAANVLHIVREALANALRHAGASHVLIRAAVLDGSLVVSVVDDGNGFDPGQPSGGFGMRDMRERAGWCRCELDVRSLPGAGTTVRIEVPLEAVSGSEAIR